MRIMPLTSWLAGDSEPQPFPQTVGSMLRDEGMTPETLPETTSDPEGEPLRWGEPPPVVLAVGWSPDEPWLPQERTRLATRDFRKGYPMTWDLEVPMRRLARPLFLRPGVKRVGPPPGTELPPGKAEQKSVPAPAPTTAFAPAPAPVSAPRGSRMKGWSKAAAWLEQDPWGNGS